MGLSEGGASRRVSYVTTERELFTLEEGKYGSLLRARGAGARRERYARENRTVRLTTKDEIKLGSGHLSALGLMGGALFYRKRRKRAPKSHFFVRGTHESRRRQKSA